MSETTVSTPTGCNMYTWEKRSGVRNGHRRIQVQLEVDGGGGSRQNWMKKVVCGLYSAGRGSNKA